MNLTEAAMDYQGRVKLYRSRFVPRLNERPYAYLHSECGAWAVVAEIGAIGVLVSVTNGSVLGAVLCGFGLFILGGLCVWDDACATASTGGFP